LIAQGFTWPAALTGTFGVLAVIASDDDRAHESVGTEVQQAARTEHRAVLKEVTQQPPLVALARDVARILRLAA
jgi:hypothetical protein